MSLQLRLQERHSHLAVSPKAATKLWNFATPDKPRNALLYISHNLVNCCTTVETSCTANPQQHKGIEIESYSWPTCSRQPRRLSFRCRQQARPWMSFVDNVIDLSWRNMAKSTKVRNKVTKFQMKVSLFWEVPKFPGKTVWDTVCQKRARFTQRFQCNTSLWRMDGHMTTAYTVLAQLCMVKMKKCINTTGWSRKVNTFSLITTMQPSKKIISL